MPGDIPAEMCARRMPLKAYIDGCQRRCRKQQNFLPNPQARLKRPHPIPYMTAHQVKSDSQSMYEPISSDCVSSNSLTAFLYFRISLLARPAAIVAVISITAHFQNFFHAILVLNVPRQIAVRALVCNRRLCSNHNFFCPNSKIVIFIIRVRMTGAGGQI